MLLTPYKGILPRIGAGVFLAPGAQIVGDVEIGEESSVWFNCVLRGDVAEVRIGSRTNIQDGTVIHTSSFPRGTIIGDDVTVGHMAMLHACTLESGSFVGMMACVMDNAVVETGGMVAAGALVTKGTRVGKGELWAGSPAKMLRAVTDKERDYIAWSAKHYVKLSRDYLPKP
jgi:carbonic anhydrase/acetyltransferase-like protein (isoleucine patch superfamily)